MPERLRILVAEDVPDNVELLKLAFSRAGVRVPVHYVRDGAETIDYLRGDAGTNPAEPRKPTMLLLDLKMPRLDGFGVLQWLRAQPVLRRILVVVFTTSAEQRDVNRAFDLGANSYVIKPVGFPELKEIVTKLESYWLKMNQVPDSAPDAALLPRTKIYLRNTKTGQYFQGGARWTDRLERALDFRFSELAIRSALEMKLEDLDIVADVGEARFNIKTR